MIRRPTGWSEFFHQFWDRIDRATYRTLQNIIRDCRDPTLTIRTLTSQDANDRNVNGWVQHFTHELARLQAFRENRPALETRVLALYPEVAQSWADYMSTVPNLITGFQQVLIAHEVDGEVIDEPITQGQRDAIADGLEAQLET